MNQPQYVASSHQDDYFNRQPNGGLYGIGLLKRGEDGLYRQIAVFNHEYADDAVLAAASLNGDGDPFHTAGWHISGGGVTVTIEGLPGDEPGEELARRLERNHNFIMDVVAPHQTDWPPPTESDEAI